MKKTLLILLAIFCWQIAHAQKPSWVFEATSIPSFEGIPQVIETQISATLDDDFGFHHFSLSQSGTFSSLNGFNSTSISPYVFMSYNPWEKYSYTSLGVSKEVALGNNMGCILYLELGVSDAVYKNWSIGIGAIYSLEIPKVNFKNKRRHPS